jgi:hypothetical protein
MPIPINDTLGIFADNIRIRKSVLPIAERKVTDWTKGLKIPAGGDTILYTGQMYQLVPIINSMSHQMAKYENSWITKYFGIGRWLNRFINLSAFMAHSDPIEQAAYDGKLRNITLLLRSAGIEFGYLYEKDFYSGALAYDEGLDQAVETQANLVYQTLKSANVKRLITVDPHTTKMMRTVFPKIIPEFNIKVQSYLEVLADRKIKPLKQIDLDVTIHDSCIYARHEGMIEPPRLLLRQIGIRIQEAELSGKITQCCGGPLESLFPTKATNIAKKRIVELSDCAGEIVTMCPLCMANLKRVSPGRKITIRDISDYLVQSYCPTTSKNPGKGKKID